MKVLIIALFMIILVGLFYFSKKMNKQRESLSVCKKNFDKLNQDSTIMDKSSSNTTINGSNGTQITTNQFKYWSSCQIPPTFYKPPTSENVPTIVSQSFDMSQPYFEDSGWKYSLERGSTRSGAGCDFFANVVCKDLRNSDGTDNDGTNISNGLCSPATIDINDSRIGILAYNSASPRQFSPWYTPGDGKPQGGTVIEVDIYNGYPATTSIIKYWGWSETPISQMFDISNNIPPDNNITIQWNPFISINPNSAQEGGTSPVNIQNQLNNLTANKVVKSSKYCGLMPTWSGIGSNAIMDSSMILWEEVPPSSGTSSRRQFVFCRDGAPNFKDKHNNISNKLYFSEFAKGSIMQVSGSSSNKVGIFNMKYYTSEMAEEMLNSATNGQNGLLPNIGPRANIVAKDTPPNYMYECPSCGGVPGCGSVGYAGGFFGQSAPPERVSTFDEKYLI